jgi:hypothetical protein
MNYKFGTKANWRRWQWNRIVERLAVPVRDAVVVYLAGPEDLDRPVALSKGFRPDNLIAVDRDGDVVKQLRMNGTLSVCATIEEVVHSWPHGRTIDAVVADYCGNMTQSRMLSVFRMRSSFAAFEAVLSVNMLRGREHDFTSTTSELNRLGLFGLKHRGQILCAVMNASIIQSCGAIGDWSRMQALQQYFMLSVRPAFSEYLSDSGQWMDSVVLAGSNPGVTRQRIEEIKAEHIDETGFTKPKVSRSISAVLAHRTMRQN